LRDLHKLKRFAGEDVFHVVVESPRGAVVKLKYSSDLGAMSISRPLVLGVTYACDWGFVPSTEGPDGDPIDAAIWWDVTTYPGVVIPCRALAVVRVEQNKADNSGRIRNDRVLVVPVATRREDALTVRVRQEIEQFLVAATALEGKEPRILGWDDGEAALALIRPERPGFSLPGTEGALDLAATCGTQECKVGSVARHGTATLG
jgi:inorganic pyrophosphatase